MRVCIAGATGFIGRKLCEALADHHQVIALTRRAVSAEPESATVSAENSPGILWRSADLFSLLQLERALEGADTAIYLVHSMLPASRLTQGRFEDLDLILADNFARAAKLRGVKRIIYVGGLMPSGELSPHLRSRFEVERALAAHGVDLVALRAGLVIGPQSSSYRIMERLVDRLPVMTCPRWTSSHCQPIALPDVIDVIVKVVDDPALPAGNYDIAGPEILSYLEMMQRVAALRNVRRLMVRVPFVSPTISRLWVSTVTNTPRALVYPLIESLQHDMVARDVNLQRRYRLQPMGFDAAVQAASAFTKTNNTLGGSTPPVSQRRGDESTVTSVQRLPLPAGRSVSWVAAEYAAWLPRFLSPLLKVSTSHQGHLRFTVRPLGPIGPELHLLELTYSPERSSKTRQLYYLTGGLLLRRVAGRPRGRLEFRAVPDAPSCIAAVLDFRPRLPWFIYRFTQALVHLLVMMFFARHLRQIQPLITATREA